MKTNPLCATLCLLLILTPLADAAQFLEVTTEIEVARKPGAPLGQHIIVSRCVFGTNTWLIDGNFVGNGQKTWWCTGSNIFEQTVWTNHDFAIPKVSAHGVGAVISPLPHDLPPANPAPEANAHPDLPVVMTNLWRHGPKDWRPLGRDFANLTWMAFCSGPFLSVPGRKILPPLPPTPDRDDTTDKTEVFAGPLGLPKRVEIYTHEKKLICQYEVTETTNYLGWTIPLQSEFSHYDTSYSTPHAARIIAKTRVTSLRATAEPTLPPEIFQRYVRRE